MTDKCNAQNPTFDHCRCEFPKGHDGAHTAVDDEGESLVWTDEQAEEIEAEREEAHK